MNDMIENFHFLRPWWLLAIIPLWVLIGYFHRRASSGKPSGWQNHVDAHLLPYLTVGQMHGKIQRNVLPWLLGLLSLFSLIGIAGPVWQKVDTPTFKNTAPTVLVLSLAQSMNADDVKPSRLKRAVHKTRDVLEKTQGQSRALIIYSDSPFVASPLTDDANVIEQMLPELSTQLMPVLGNRLDLAIDEAVGLLQRGGAPRGRIIALTDSVGDMPSKTHNAVTRARAVGYPVSLLGIGTEKGAILQTADGRAITQSGQTVTTTLDQSALAELAASGDGTFMPLSAGDNDVKQLLESTQPSASAGKQSNAFANTWQDQGFWLLLLPIIIMPFLFRKGVLFALVIGLSIGFNPHESLAAEAPSAWSKLWQTPDQQGQQAYDAGNYERAEHAFSQPEWSASAAYKAGNYQRAADTFQAQGNHYNAGNALAKAGDLAGALSAYEKALKANPEDENAQFNHDLVKKLLEEQQEQQQQQKRGEEQNQDKDQENKQNQSQDSESEDKSEQQNQADNQNSQDTEGDSSSDATPENSDTQDNTTENPADNPAENGGKAGDEDSDKKSDLPEWENEAGKETEADSEQKDNKENDSEQKAKPIVPVPALDQATEQQLRRVPDDPSGLLRHRIRQHYRRQQ